MKKLILLLLTGILLSCSSDSSTKDKAFYAVAYATCSPTEIENIPLGEVFISFMDEDWNDISYQPKKNTWYRACYGNACFWYKTGNNVTPQNADFSSGVLSIEYNSPCQ